MLDVTEAYKEDIRANIRSEMMMRVEFGLINPFAVTNDTFSANSTLDYSSFKDITEQEVFVRQSYATMENNRTKADGALLVPPEIGDTNEFGETTMLYQGYISGVVSGEDGTFSEQPYINITFAEPLTLPGLSMTFDRVMNMWPTKFRITAMLNGSTVYDETWDNDGVLFAETFPVPLMNTFRITFLATQEPHQYVRVMQLKYGINITWNDNQITSSGGIKKVVDIDPINRRLPTSTIEVNVLDYEHFFDMDKPKGIYSVIQTQLPIEAFFGKRISQPMKWSDVNQSRWSEINESTWLQLHGGGYIEWFSVGTFLLDSKPEWKDDVATLRAHDLIGFMTDVYKKGVFRRQNLYDLAVDVINDAGLVPRDDHREHYVFWQGLRWCITIAPLPFLPHNECLRLIAHAANCVYYTDWEGRIHIEPLSATQHDYNVDYSFDRSIPTAEKSPTLYAVDCEATYYQRTAEQTYRWEKSGTGSVIEGEGDYTREYQFYSGVPVMRPKVETLYAETIEIDGEYFVSAEYDMATDITVEAIFQGSYENVPIISQGLYARYFELTLSGSGTVKLTISGVKLTTVTEIKRAYSGGDPNGEIELLQNPLINSADAALSVATYVKDWLSLRTAYKVQYRGDPALESLDLVYAQSEFTDKFKARVLKHEWKYDGGLQGDLIIKNLEAKL